MLSPAQQRLLPGEVAQGWNVLSKTQHIATGKNTTMEHYLKVVHTTYLIGSGRGKNLETYQYTVNNNNYEDGELPAANPNPSPNPSPSPTPTPTVTPALALPLPLTLTRYGAGRYAHSGSR